MKKLLLLSFLMLSSLNAQPNHFKSAEYLDRLKNIIADAKDLVIDHPYTTAAISVGVLVTIYWYCQPKEEVDPSWSNLSPQTSPQVSPQASINDFKDYTGDFPHPARSNLHGTKLRHK